MASKIYLGVKFRKYERIAISLDLNTDIENLQSEFSKQMELPEEDIVFLYCGKPLEGDKTLTEQGLQPGSTVHVLRKVKKPPPQEYTQFTEIDVQDAVSLFRSIKAVNFHKALQPEFIKKVLESHPEVRNDLAAMSILKDPILLASLRNGDSVRLLAEHHRCLLDASKTIVDFLKTTAEAPNHVSTVTEVENDQLSDSSSESEASPSTSNQVRSTMRRITTEQLASALNFAGTNSRNSLASISQRNLNQQQSTDSSSPAAAASTANNSTPTPTRITNSMFMNALSEVLLSTRAQARTTDLPSTTAANPPATVEETGIAPPSAASDAPMPVFLSELQQMREMGLNDTEINLQALMITNGDVEAAVNLVFSGINN